MAKKNIKETIKAVKVPKKVKKPYEEDTPIQVRIVIGDDDDNTDVLENVATHIDGVKHVKTARAAEDEVFEALNGSNHKEHFHFEPNTRYFTICVYAFVLIAVASLVIFGITKIEYLSNAFLGLLSVLSPFIAGFMLAFLLNPLVSRLDRVLFLNFFKIKSPKARRILAMLLSYILVLGLITVILVYVLPQIGESFTDLFNKRDAIFTLIEENLEKLEKVFPNVDVDFIEAKIYEYLPQLFTFLTDAVKNVIPMILSLSVSIAKLTFNILLAIAISIYILYDKRELTKLATRVLYSIMPIGRATKLTQVAKECGNIFGSFVIGKSIDSLIIGIICFIVLTIFGFPYAILVSVVVGITNMIPYFGPFIGAIPGVLLYLVISPMDALAFAFIILIIQQFDGWVLGPAILGESTGLSPLWVIFAITVGGAYAGVLGMFLGVPVTAVIAYLANQFLVAKLKRKRLDIS